MRRTVPTTDGRVLLVEDRGDPAGRPVLVHNGTPACGHLYEPHVRDAADRGLRLIGYDRPGYGGSSPQPGRTVADCTADVRTICAELGIDRLGIWGISGGGPHALACAAILPDLVSAVASLAAEAPPDADGLDYFAGMGQFNVDHIKLFHSDPEAARAQLESNRQEVLATPAEDAARGLESLLTPTDAAALNGELAEYLTQCMHDGLAPGCQGWWDDNCLLMPWGFDVADIAVPVLLMHGRQDMFVPFGHGQWLAAHIPGVEARLLDNDGHITLLQNRIPEVHAWLADHL